ncbi:oogenesis-related [Osmerus mordax]|uniref:oogenesis-related n=1 Tax=Osmerus mordax TaxID=8014 RepID=UPI00350F89EF
MTSESSVNIEQKGDTSIQEVSAKRGGVVRTTFCRLSQFWPISLMMRTLRGFWRLFGFSTSEEKAVIGPVGEEVDHSPRQCLSVRKRLSRFTRLLLAILPRRVQGALGYPVCTSIGCSLSPELRVSPTKPCGKGSKRKQDDLEEDDEQEPVTWATWVNQELAEEEDSAVDPDYEVSLGETDSEEYCSQNDTECELELQHGLVVIDDLDTPETEEHSGQSE